jgi:mannose-6-phosphate isomerase
VTVDARASAPAQPFEPYPLLLRPHLYRRIWGGARLAEWLGAGPEVPVSGPTGEPVGECWLVDAGNLVENGRYAGLTLGELARTHGAALVGSTPAGRYGARVPLLAKFLDAASDLSVQVHPDDAYAASVEAASGHLGKAEAWLMLACDAEASVLRGFVRDVTEAEARAALADGTFADLLHRVRVREGDVVVNPAGTVHAVGAGCFLFEIQQASDLTYRLYDYGRTGADGKPRELHVERALAVADLTGGPYAPRSALPGPGGWRRAVELPEFVLDACRLTPGAPLPGATTARSLELIVLTGGTARLSAAGRTLALGRGAAVVLPASLGGYALEGDADVLKAAVGEGA